MFDHHLEVLLERVSAAQLPCQGDLESLLGVADDRQIARIFAFADSVRKQYMGDGVLLRGLIEFSNHCRNSCAYCGLNKSNKSLQRYRLTDDEILASAALIASQRIKTIVIQSGEDEELDVQKFAETIRRIKTRYDMAITLSLGERSTDEYRLWREAGADRYLLKIETSDKALYESLHPEMSFETRLRCLDDLRMLGYQVGSGCLVGLKGQTIASLAADIIFFARRQLEMIGIGPFIPHVKTELASQPTGNVQLTLKVIALTRIVVKDAHIPGTTALGSIGPGDGRVDALRAGANVLMPNFTPLPYRQLYDIYPGKRCITEAPGACAFCMDAMVASIGRTIDHSRGDSPRFVRTPSLDAANIVRND
ncbi:MAG TPA: [FeFe] hydrogenase H-cluster radical SAM maturase HydE [Sedimentisphaerales bacterium]|nr:[FeFe] hydrogenase H-cluster radical SAM maturase HydE [Sedimentisphaerales bacterium]